jgi:hypothetical protein
MSASPDPAAMAEAKRPLSLLWRRSTLDTVLEGYFIKEVLLGGLERPIRLVAIEESARAPLLDDALVVSLGTEMAPYLREARARGARNLGLFHMGDESGKQDRGFYAQADYVIRNYWFEHVFAASGGASLGVWWVPNGYRTGLGPMRRQTMLGAGERQTAGFFAGVLTDRMLADQRAAMMQAVAAAKLPFVVIGTPGFGQGLGPVTYASCLANARFALVPAGNSHETIRLYDALEAGAIPIMVKSPFVHAHDALDNPPFLLLESWEGLAEAYRPYADVGSPATVAALERMRQDVAAWWVRFKSAQQRKVKDIVDRAFARSATAGRAQPQR